MRSSTPTSNEPGLNTISVTKMFISNVGISNQTANIQIKLHGPKINSEYSTTPYNQIKNTIGKAQNLKIPLIDIVNNNTNTKSEEKEDIPGSFHNLTRSINSIGFGSFDAIIGSDKSSGIGLKPYTASLSGDPLTFPLDHYSVDLIIEIPFKHVHIQRDVKGVGTGELYKSGWNPPDPEIASCSNIHSNIMNFICDPQTRNDQISNHTFVKIHMDFTRNDFSFWAIIFPIFFIFFLLGIVCFLEPKDDYLVARIAITLGVFAFVFTFDAILPGREARLY